MKHLFVLFFVFVCLGIKVNGQENAKLYFIRSTGFAGSATAFTVFVDDSLQCKLNNKKYSIHDVPPGDHFVSVQFAGKESKIKAEKLKVKFEAGRSYYVQLIIKQGFTMNNLYCMEITENSANMLMEGLKEDVKCE